MSTTVDDRSERPDDIQLKNPKTNKKESKKEQGDSLYSEIPEWLQEFRENLVDDEIPVHGDSHASSSWVISVYTHFPKDRNCEGPKLQGPHAEDVIVEPYLVLKILVT